MGIRAGTDMSTSAVLAGALTAQNRLFAAIALTIMLATALVACDDGSTEPQPPVTVKSQATLALQ